MPRTRRRRSRATRWCFRWSALRFWSRLWRLGCTCSSGYHLGRLLQSYLPSVNKFLQVRGQFVLLCFDTRASPLCRALGRFAGHGVMFSVYGAVYVVRFDMFEFFNGVMERVLACSWWRRSNRSKATTSSSYYNNKQQWDELIIMGRGEKKKETRSSSNTSTINLA